MTPAESTFERTVVEALVSHGWREGAPTRFDAQRALLPGDLIDWLREGHAALHGRLVAAWGAQLPERLSRALDEALRDKGTPAVLRDGFRFEGEAVPMAVFPPAGTPDAETKARLAAQRLVVTPQARIEPAGRKSLDLLLSLNGVPVATVELKHRPNGQTAAEAMAQYRARPSHLPLFAWPSRAVVHFAVDDQEAWMTTRVEGEQTRFVPFNRGTEEGDAGNPPSPVGGYATDYLWNDLWTPAAFLTLLRRYVHVLKVTESRDGRDVVERRLLFPRWHQRDAVRALVADVEARGPGQRYLVEHSAGSGKSNTIAWLAWHLADLTDGAEGSLFDKVVVVTDRTVLDAQLAETIAQMTARPAQVCHVRAYTQEARRARNLLAGERSATGGGTLVEALDDPGVRVVIVTVQTFLDAPDALDTRRRRSFAVILDEAHGGVGEKSDAAMGRLLSSEAGDDYLRDYAARRQHPNQSLFAFTATPKRETLFLYGVHAPTVDAPERRVPFHRYRMRQAIAEGFIEDVLRGYVRYRTYLRLRGVGVDHDDPELDARRAAAAVWREVFADPKTMAAKARIIAGHFLARVRPLLDGRARAMVVASSRDAALAYARALRTELDRRGAKNVGVLVAFSGAVDDPLTGGTVTEAEVNGFPEGALAKRFATGDHRILVVANKYQTGFDQPLLCAMYIDRPLDDVQAVQTLSRLNRPCGAGRKPVFALDFVNDAEVPDAFARFYDGTTLTQAPDLDAIDELRAHLDAAGVYTAHEVEEVARLALSPDTGLSEGQRQERIHGVVSVARSRFTGLPEGAQETFRSELTEFVRLYALVAQVTEAPDAALEALATYGMWLLPTLPRTSPRHAMEDVRGRIAVEYVRLVPTGGGLAAAHADRDGDDDAPHPGELQLVARVGAAPADATVRLSELLARLNQLHGLGASPEDRASVEALLSLLLGEGDVVEALRGAADPRDLAHDKEVQRQVRLKMRERASAGDGFAERFTEAHGELRDEIVAMVLEVAGLRVREADAKAQAEGALSADDLARLAELNVLRNSVEPRVRALVRRELERAHGGAWIDAVLRCVPQEFRRGLSGLSPEVVLGEKLYLRTLITVVDQHWGKVFGPVLEEAPTQVRLSRAQCRALLEVLDAHREDAHARPIREVDLATVRGVVEQLQRVLDRALR